MADNLLESYNPLYDVHLRQYFALPHMQKHLRNVGLLENQKGDEAPDNELYARHHAMMDMLLRNRERVLQQLADLHKKLDAAEKVEICRRIRSGITNAEEFRRSHMSRSLSRPARGRSKRSAGEHQRRYSNSFEDGEMIKRIESGSRTENDAQQSRNIYNRLAASVYKYQYLHKLDDRTLLKYMQSLRKQLQKLERFRELSFGPNSVARHQPNLQNSWFFRRRSLPSLTSSAPPNTLHQPLRSMKSLRKSRSGKSQSPRKFSPAEGQSAGASAKNRPRPYAALSRSRPPPQGQRLPPLPKPAKPFQRPTAASGDHAVPKLPPTAMIKPTVQQAKRQTPPATAASVISPKGKASSVKGTPSPIQNNVTSPPPSVGGVAASVLPAIGGVAAGAAIVAALASTGDQNETAEHVEENAVEDRQSPVESTGMAPSEESLPFKHERFIRSSEQGEVQSESEFEANGSAAYGDTETRPTPEPFLEEANLAENEAEVSQSPQQAESSPPPAAESPVHHDEAELFKESHIEPSPSATPEAQEVQQETEEQSPRLDHEEERVESSPQHEAEQVHVVEQQYDEEEDEHEPIEHKTSQYHDEPPIESPYEKEPEESNDFVESGSIDHYQLGHEHGHEETASPLEPRAASPVKLHSEEQEEEHRAIFGDEHNEEESHVEERHFGIESQTAATLDETPKYSLRLEGLGHSSEEQRTPTLIIEETPSPRGSDHSDEEEEIHTHSNVKRETPPQENESEDINGNVKEYHEEEQPETSPSPRDTEIESQYDEKPEAQEGIVESGQLEGHESPANESMKEQDPWENRQNETPLQSGRDEDEHKYEEDHREAENATDDEPESHRSKRSVEHYEQPEEHYEDNIVEQNPPSRFEQDEVVNVEHQIDDHHLEEITGMEDKHADYEGSLSNEQPIRDAHENFAVESKEVSNYDEDGDERMLTEHDNIEQPYSTRTYEESQHEIEDRDVPENQEAEHAETQSRKSFENESQQEYGRESIGLEPEDAEQIRQVVHPHPETEERPPESVRSLAGSERSASGFNNSSERNEEDIESRNGEVHMEDRRESTHFGEEESVKAESVHDSYPHEQYEADSLEDDAHNEESHEVGHSEIDRESVKAESVVHEPEHTDSDSVQISAEAHDEPSTTYHEEEHELQEPIENVHDSNREDASHAEMVCDEEKCYIGGASDHPDHVFSPSAMSHEENIQEHDTTVAKDEPELLEPESATTELTNEEELFHDDHEYKEPMPEADNQQENDSNKAEHEDESSLSGQQHETEEKMGNGFDHPEESEHHIDQKYVEEETRHASPEQPSQPRSESAADNQSEAGSQFSEHERVSQTASSDLHQREENMNRSPTANSGQSAVNHTEQHHNEEHVQYHTEEHSDHNEPDDSPLESNNTEASHSTSVTENGKNPNTDQENGIDYQHSPSVENNGFDDHHREQKNGEESDEETDEKTGLLGNDYSNGGNVTELYIRQKRGKGTESENSEEEDSGSVIIHNEHAGETGGSHL
ncbi:hypothetical protein Ddc_03713 [Ditylenchus destructor]|nr:hypothetical protein Ddc_03713 [Ditylenchus destructor]